MGDLIASLLAPRSCEFGVLDVDVDVVTVELASHWELEAAGMVLDWSDFPPHPAAGAPTRLPTGARARALKAAIREARASLPPEKLIAASIIGPGLATAEAARASAPAPGVGTAARQTAIRGPAAPAPWSGGATLGGAPPRGAAPFAHGAAPEGFPRAGDVLPLGSAGGASSRGGAGGGSSRGGAGAAGGASSRGGAGGASSHGGVSSRGDASSRGGAGGAVGASSRRGAGPGGAPRPPATPVAPAVSATLKDAAAALIDAGAGLIWIVEDPYRAVAPADLVPLLATIRALHAIPALLLAGPADAAWRDNAALRQAVPVFDPVRSPGLAEDAAVHARRAHGLLDGDRARLVSLP
jgi:hypothetical protein